MWLELILTIVGSLIGLGAIFFYFYQMRRIVRIDVSPNMAIVENDYRSEFTDGYTLFSLKKQTPCKNGTTRFELYPIDVEQGEDIPRPPMQTVIVANEFIKRFARGKLSGYRERIKLIHRDPTRIPEEMRGTTEGEWATKEGQLAHLKSILHAPLITAGDEATVEFLKDHTRVGLARKDIARQREKAEQLKIIEEGMEKKHSEMKK